MGFLDFIKKGSEKVMKGVQATKDMADKMEQSNIEKENRRIQQLQIKSRKLKEKCQRKKKRERLDADIMRYQKEISPQESGISEGRLGGRILDNRKSDFKFRGF